MVALQDHESTNYNYYYDYNGIGITRPQAFSYERNQKRPEGSRVRLMAIQTLTLRNNLDYAGLK